MYVWQIYSITAIKSGCVIAWKALMTVEAAGLRGSGQWCEPINPVSWPSSDVTEHCSYAASVKRMIL